MKKSKLSFDSLFQRLSLKIPFLGKRIVNYYQQHEWFKRFAKFAVSTFVMYWLVKGPLIWILTGLMPSLNLFLLIIPSYVVAAFFAGIIVTCMGFVLNEVWVWKKRSRG